MVRVKADERVGAAKMWRDGMARADPIRVCGRVKRQRTRGNGVEHFGVGGAVSLSFSVISGFNGVAVDEDEDIDVDWISILPILSILSTLSISISISTPMPMLTSEVSDGIDVGGSD